MKILILEDEKVASEFLEKMIQDNLEDCQVVGKAESVKEASRLYHALKPDVLIMDINLGDHLGFELFEYIDASQLHVIFTTGYQEFAVKAFKINAVDYLMKPVNLDDLVFALSKANDRFRLKELSSQSAFSNKEKEMSGMMLVWENNKLIPVRMDEIIKIKSDGTYSRLFLINEKKIYTSKNLGVYESILKERGFIRIHNSCLMNPLHLVSYKPGIRAFVTLSDQKIEYVSKNKKKDLLKVIRLPVS